jgi:thiamine-monophosphate kinase
LRQLYLEPAPPVGFAPLIARFASASMDISDGFVGDLRKMARASGVSFDVDGAALPFSAPVREALEIPGALAAALTGGDDYQFLFTVPTSRIAAFREALGAQPVTVTQIGSAIAPGKQPEVCIHGLEGVDLDALAGSYSHF